MKKYLGLSVILVLLLAAAVFAFTNSSMHRGGGSAEVDCPMKGGNAPEKICDMPDCDKGDDCPMKKGEAAMKKDDHSCPMKKQS